MKKVITLFICCCITCLVCFPSVVYADDCVVPNCDPSGSDCWDQLQKAKDKCSAAISQIEAAKKPHVDELQKLQNAITAFQLRIKTIEAESLKKAQAIAAGETELSGLLDVAGVRIRSFYMRSTNTSPLFVFLSSASIGSALRTYGYQQAVVNEDKKVIAQTATMVKDLEDRKAALEIEKANLAALKADIDKKAASIKQLVDSANAYENVLNTTLAAVSAKQQSFLAQKLAGLGIPLYAMSGGGCSSDLTNGKDPGFSGGFGFFTFGVPNRVGLNQYGAYGRAKAGKNSDEILRAYYSFDGYQSADSNITIRVNDSNSMNQGNIIWSGKLNDYVKRVYEVPADWPGEALKAQVIAIRSYVLATTDNGSMSICATQYCQVFKTGEKGGSWNQAVDDTQTQIMVQGGKPIKAFFSSTHGGYAFNTGDLQGWSTTGYTKRMVDTPNGSVSSFSDLRNNAYDKDSPWFYCDWGGRSQYGGTAWLKPEEVADIVNVLLLAKQDSSTQQHLVQTDKTNPDGVDTWDASTVRSKLGGSAYTTIDSVSVSFDTGTGRTTQVTVSGNGKTNSFSGDEFKTYFNLRAPSTIQIVGPLFNVERK